MSSVVLQVNWTYFNKLWMASLTRWTWVSVNSGSWCWTGRPGVLQFMGLQRVEHDWATDLIGSDSFKPLPYLLWWEFYRILICSNNLHFCVFFYFLFKYSFLFLVFLFCKLSVHVFCLVSWTRHLIIIWWHILLASNIICYWWELKMAWSLWGWES